MLSQLERAFDGLLRAKAQVSPEGREFVTINGRRHEAIIEDISFDESIVSGGTGEAGQMRAKCRRREFSNVPEKGDAVKIRGRALEIVGPVIDRNGVELEITMGDMSAQ